MQFDAFAMTGKRGGKYEKGSMSPNVRAILYQLSESGAQTRLELEYKIGRGSLERVLHNLNNEGRIKFTGQGKGTGRQYEITRKGLASINVHVEAPPPKHTRITNYNHQNYVPSQFQNMGRVGLAVYQ